MTHHKKHDHHEHHEHETPEDHLRLQAFNWNRGVLEVVEIIVKSIEDAYERLRQIVCCFFKIFSFDNILICCGHRGDDGERYC